MASVIPDFVASAADDEDSRPHVHLRHHNQSFQPSLPTDSPPSPTQGRCSRRSWLFRSAFVTKSYHLLLLSGLLSVLDAKSQEKGERPSFTCEKTPTLTH